MANIHEDNESCKERMKEHIRKGLDRTEVIREVKKEFLNVNNDTFYRWYDSVILEQDIKEWERENKEKVVSLYDHKRKAKIDMYYWTYNRYERQLKKFENKQSEDPELLDEIYKLQDRLHNNYLKKVE